MDVELVVLLGGILLLLAYQAWKWRKDGVQARNFLTNVEDIHLPHTPKVSILVAAWNEAGYIENHIRSVLSLRYPNKEFVLCVGGADKTLEIARGYAGPRVIVLEQKPGEGKQRSLQRCLECSNGEIIFLTDADSLLDDVAFERTLAPLINKNETAATGDIQPYPLFQTSPFVLQNWFIELYSQTYAPKYIQGLRGVNAAISRHTLSTAGEFRAPIKTGTDYYLAKQLLAQHSKIRHVKQSWVFSEFSVDLRNYARRQSRWLRNVVLHGWQFGAYPEVIRCLLSSFIGLGMWIGLFLALWLRGWFLIAWLLLFLHSGFNRLRYIFVGERLSGVRFPLKGYFQLPVFLWIDYTVWMFVFLDYLRPNLRTRW